jgi:heptosyltransferase-2
MALPAMRVMAATPSVSLSVLTGPYTARVFMHQPGIGDIRVDWHGGRAKRVLARARSLRSAGADVAVVFPPSFSSALPPWAARVPRRAGFRADGRNALLTDALAMPSRDVHLIESYLGLARAALRGSGLEPARTPEVRLHVTGDERNGMRTKLAGFGRDGYVVVVPGAAFGPAKSWPGERYRALCTQLSRDIPVVLAGSAGDRRVCERIAHDLSGVRSVAGTTSLGELFALIEGARALVANDSGAPHAAAALDVPVVVLFGSTSPAWTAPAGRRVQVLQHKVHCNPCYRRTCPTQLECFNGIDVTDVLAAVGRSLDRSPVAAP